MRWRTLGFSLIELIVFIVILGVLAAGILIGLDVASQRSQDVEGHTAALDLAEARMDMIIGQRIILGFSNFSDLCAGGSPPAMCTVPSGYTVSSSIANDWNGDSNFKVITVTVSGDGTATLKTLVANYT